MNFGIAPNPAISTPGKGVADFFTGIFGRYWAVLLLILAIFVGLVIYHKFVGYYLDMGWKKVWDLLGKRETVEMKMDDEDDETTKPIFEAAIKPMEENGAGSGLGGPGGGGGGGGGSGSLLPASERPLGMPGATDSDNSIPSVINAALGTNLETSVIGSTSERSLSTPEANPFTMPTRTSLFGGKQVFNVSRNIYTFSDAAAVCAAFDSELATYEQIQAAHKSGADWCNYGWVKGQMAVYPTQKATWDKLQKGSPEYRGSCGQPGVNGGYFDNPDLRFGVNCYGKKPSKSAFDELNESSVALPLGAEEIEFEKRVRRYRDQIGTMTVLPFSRGNWTA